jgi:hypothetical protein
MMACMAFRVWHKKILFICIGGIIDEKEAPSCRYHDEPAYRFNRKAEYATASAFTVYKCLNGILLAPKLHKLLPILCTSIHFFSP